MAELLPEEIRRVPGVFSVQAKLRARPAPDKVTYFERLINPH